MLKRDGTCACCRRGILEGTGRVARAWKDDHNSRVVDLCRECGRVMDAAGMLRILSSEETETIRAEASVVAGKEE